MARLFNGTSDAMAAATVDLSGVSKLTLSFWLWWDSFSNNDDLAMEFTGDINSSTGGFIVNPNSSTAGGGKMDISLRGDVGYTVALINRPSAAAWHHFAALLDKTKSTNEVDSIYVDGVSQSITYNANSNNTNSFSLSTLYFMSRAATSLFGAGRLAEVAIYPGVLLGVDEITALSKRVSPILVRPTAKPYYWPLIGRTSPELELFYGRTATLTGTSNTEHPAMIYGASPMLDINAPTPPPSMASWFVQASQPLPRKRSQIGSEIFAPLETPTAAETVTMDKWYQPIGQPLKRKPKIHPEVQVSFVQPAVVVRDGVIVLIDLVNSELR